MPKVARSALLVATMVALPLAGTACERYKKPPETTYTTESAEPGATRDIDGKIAGPGADFSNMVLKGKNLAQLDLTGANFSGTKFDHTFLSASILVGANFENAKFQASNAYRADFTDANLTNASFLVREPTADASQAALDTLKLNGARMPDGSVHKK